MSRLTKALMYLIGTPVVGYLLMKIVTPSPDKMREILAQKDPAVNSQIRKRNKELMKVIQKEAGIPEVKLKEK